VGREADPVGRGDAVEVGAVVRRDLAGCGVEGRDLAEDLVEDPGEDVPENQGKEDRDTADEPTEGHGADDREGHDQQRHPLVLRPVDVGDDRSQVEPDQHDDCTGDDRRQDAVQDARPEVVDEHAHQSQDEAGDQDRPGDLRRVAALGADRGDAADERGGRAEVAGDSALHDQQEADRGDAAHHDRELGVEPHDDREHEGGPEHRDHVLGTEACGPAPGQPLVRGDDVVRARGASALVQSPPQTQGHADSFCTGGTASWHASSEMARRGRPPQDRRNLAVGRDSAPGRVARHVRPCVVSVCSLSLPRPGR
jgi:hypothetical protein